MWRAVQRRPLLSERGVRILSMDGGGMKARGLAGVQGVPGCAVGWAGTSQPPAWACCCARLCPVGRGGTCPRLLCQAAPAPLRPPRAQGIATVRLLRELEARTGRRIHEMFDLICGTSTGGLLAVALGLRKLSLDECDHIYKVLGQKVGGGGRGRVGRWVRPARSAAH